MSWQSWTTVRSTRSIGNRWWTSKAASESFSTTASFGCTPGMSVTPSARPFFCFSSKPRSLDSSDVSHPQSLGQLSNIIMWYQVCTGFSWVSYAQKSQNPSQSMSVLRVHQNDGGSPRGHWQIHWGANAHGDWSDRRLRRHWARAKSTESTGKPWGKPWPSARPWRTHIFNRQIMETWRNGILSSCHLYSSTCFYPNNVQGGAPKKPVMLVGL